MHSEKNIPMIFVGILGIIFGIIICVIFVKFDLINENFIDLTLSVILEWVLHILVLTYLTYLFAEKLSKHQQKRDTILKFMDEISKDLEFNAKDLLDSLKNNKYNDKKNILMKIRHTSNKVYCLDLILKKYSNNLIEDYKKVSLRFENLREIITNENWNKKNISMEEQNLIEKERLNLIKDINFLKVKIFD